MIQTSSQHHSFDIELAQKYGVHEAILIHHFKHWIRINKAAKRNFIDGRTWTYQTIDEIAAHFPYMTVYQVEELIERLCLGRSRRSKSKELEFEPVLVKGNFNQSKYDRTTWYAFADDLSGIVANDEMEVVECRNQSRQLPPPIPDTIPDTKTDKRKDYVPSAEAEGLAKRLVASIKMIKKDFKEPNLKSWSSEIDRAIRIDKRSPQAIQRVIDWLPKNYFWSKNILSADKLREQFDRLELEMEKERESRTQFSHKNNKIPYDDMASAPPKTEFGKGAKSVGELMGLSPETKKDAK